MADLTFSSLISRWRIELSRSATWSLRSLISLLRLATSSSDACDEAAPLPFTGGEGVDAWAATGVGAGAAAAPSAFSMLARYTDAGRDETGVACGWGEGAVATGVGAGAGAGTGVAATGAGAEAWTEGFGAAAMADDSRRDSRLTRMG